MQAGKSLSSETDLLTLLQVPSPEVRIAVASQSSGDSKSTPAQPSLRSKPNTDSALNLRTGANSSAVQSVLDACVDVGDAGAVTEGAGAVGVGSDGVIWFASSSLGVVGPESVEE